MEASAASILEDARKAGVGRIVCVGIDPETSRQSLHLAESFPGVFSTAGVHPHSASSFDRPAGSAIEELVAHPLVVGVGETGLDYYRRLSPPEDQLRAFRSHIGLSRESGKPLVVHVRDAWDDAMEILGEQQAENVILHCFSGDASLAEEAVARGYFISFAGNVTYPGAGRLQDAARAVSGERLLVETDSPFLSPQPVRGKKNSPENLRLVLEAVADLRGVEFTEIVNLTVSNATAAFGLQR